MPSISVLYPMQPAEIGSVIPYARIAETTSGRRLWCGQSLNIETHQLFAALIGTGLDVGYGSSVTLMPLRHPLTAAVCARSTAALSGRTYIAGVGPAAASMQQRMLGRPYASPVAATLRYATMMRTLLDGGTVEESDGPWPTEGIALPPMDSAPVEIGLGVLRESMAKLAGEVADWAITWLTPHNYIRDRIAPTVAKAAAGAGRPVPRISAVVHCAVDRPGRDLTNVAFHSAGQHLLAPHYCDMLNQAGIPVDPANNRAGAALLVEHGVVTTGSPEDIAAVFERYHEAGVDEIIVNVGGVHMTEGPGAALRDLSNILVAAESRDSR